VESDDVRRGAKDAAGQLGFVLVDMRVERLAAGESIYRFAFDADGADATAELLISAERHVMAGDGLRSWVLGELLAVLSQRPESP
jgi:hypothetical protein